MLRLGADGRLRKDLAMAARKTAETQFSAELFGSELHKAILAKG
jgi:hypothetical protein